jgi:integrase
MLGTGLRRGEALALHWSDVDLTNGHVRVRWTLGRVDKALVFDEPKTNRSRRFVPLPSPIAETLRRHRAAQAAERLAAVAWAPWVGHEDLVFRPTLGRPQTLGTRLGRSTASLGAPGWRMCICTR